MRSLVIRFNRNALLQLTATPRNSAAHRHMPAFPAKTSLTQLVTLPHSSN